MQTLRLLRRVLRYMSLRDVVHLIVKPFLGRTKGYTSAEVMSRAVEHQDLRTAAAEMTQLADEALERAMRASREERERMLAGTGPQEA